MKEAFSRRESGVRAGCLGGFGRREGCVQQREDDVAAALLLRCGCVKTVWELRCSSAGAAWGRRGSYVKVAWGLRGGGVRAALAQVAMVTYCVGAVWGQRGGNIGAVRGWHGSEARAAPEVRFKGCTS